MLFRVLIVSVLVIVVGRAAWRLLEGIIEGIVGRPASGPPQRGVRMVRDPVCGTFVVPAQALTLTEGRQQLYFCSPRCRDAYRAKTA